jgi:hypothetical protein
MGGLDHLEALRDAIVRVVDIHSSPFSHETPGVGSQFVGVLQGLHQVLGSAAPDHVAGWIDDRDSPATLRLHFISAGLYTEVEVRSGTTDMLVQVRAQTAIVAVEFPTLPVPRVQTHFNEWDEFLGTAMRLTFVDAHSVELPATAFGQRGRSFEGFKNAVLSEIN